MSTLDASTVTPVSDAAWEALQGAYGGPTSMRADTGAPVLLLSWPEQPPMDHRRPGPEDVLRPGQAHHRHHQRTAVLRRGRRHQGLPHPHAHQAHRSAYHGPGARLSLGERGGGRKDQAARGGPVDGGEVGGHVCADHTGLRIMPLQPCMDRYAGTVGRDKQHER